MNFSLDKLKEKKGPLPLWAWIVLVAGVGFIAYRMFGAKPEPLPGNEQGGDGEFQSTQSMTKTDPKTGEQYTTSYSAQGKSYIPGQMMWNQAQLQPQQGDVYVNYPADNGGNGGANYLGRSHGFWFTTYRDMYPQEIAQQAYNSADYQGKPDFVSLAYNAIAIMLANPDVKPQGNNLIPKGTKLFIPGDPGNPNNGSTWNDLTPEDSAPYERAPVVPAPQTTREVRTA